MKAIQITAPSEMKVVDIEKPVLKPGEVLVKIKYMIYFLSAENCHRCVRRAK